MTAFTLALRPEAPGTKGSVALATTNCFRVSIVRKLAFYHYHVHSIRSIPSNNEIKGVMRRRELITSLYVRDHPKVFQPGQVVYDGRAGLYTSKDLGSDGHLHFEIRETYGNSTGGIIHIELKKAGYIRPEDFESLLSSQNRPDSTLIAQQIMNLLLQNSTPPEFRKVATRNTMFSLAGNKNLDMGLLFVRGCFASVRLAREHLLLNVDVCSAIMYESGDLITVAKGLLGARDARDLAHGGAIPKLLSVLKRVRVRQTKGGKVGRVRTIKDIIPRAGEERFHLEDGTETTVAEFFFRVHNCRLRHPNLPGIRIIKKGRHGEDTERTEIIPFEVLEVVEGQFYRRKMNQKILQHIHALSKLRPGERMDMIQNYLQAFNPAALDSAGLHVDRHLVPVRGRRLPPPFICFEEEIRVKPKDGTWRMKDAARFWKPCTIKFWAALVYENSCDMDFASMILRHIRSCLESLGANVSMIKQEDLTILQMNPQNDKAQDIRQIFMKVQDMENRKLSADDMTSFLLLVILPGGGKTVLHEQIKRVGDTTASPGMITQCLSWDALEGMDGQRSGMVDQYITNVALKINAKMGGVNFVPVKEGMEWIHNPRGKEATMVVGLDVSHPGPGIFRPSMASMVYSVDEYASRYFPICFSQPPRLEYIKDLEDMIYIAMARFGSHVASTFKRYFLPTRLLVYRDGLSDGELDNVGTMEIKALKAGIKRLWKDRGVKGIKEPTVTYVVVGKRHHIRFFPERGMKDKSGNCPSGFVTDDPCITSPHVYDFFLQSHAGLLGTSRPAHYMVLLDENKLSVDQMQSITFGLCHTFARATRAVSVPAPVYYAHLACIRAGIHIEYKDDESIPSSMGIKDIEYNEKDWKFYGINGLQSRLMYFA